MASRQKEKMVDTRPERRTLDDRIIEAVRIIDSARSDPRVGALLNKFTRPSMGELLDALPEDSRMKLDELNLHDTSLDTVFLCVITAPRGQSVFLSPLLRKDEIVITNGAWSARPNTPREGYRILDPTPHEESVSIPKADMPQIKPGRELYQSVR